MSTVTLDVAANYNAPNNPAGTSLFTYGLGGSPGAFTPFTSSRLNNEGTPTYDSYVIVPGGHGSVATWNGTPSTAIYESPFNTIHQPPTMVRLDPQDTAGAILRFTAPVHASFTVSGRFEGIDNTQQATNVYVYANGVLQMSGSINSFGGTAPFSFTVPILSAGQTIDFIVTTNSGFQFLSTGVLATISFDGGSTPFLQVGNLYFAT